MFTGIVRERGSVVGADGDEDGITLRVDAPITAATTGIGDSISIDGVCLTAEAVDDETIRFHAVSETLGRSTLGRLGVGDAVNVEPALRAGEPLGGHIVQGHVDAVGEVLAPVPDLRVGMPDDLRRYIIEKGSITVDGVSLTVVQPTDDGFTVAVIPHTAEVTTLGAKQPGDTVNLEVDLIAKYTERLLAFQEEP